MSADPRDFHDERAGQSCLFADACPSQSAMMIQPTCDRIMCPDYGPIFAFDANCQESWVTQQGPYQCQQIATIFQGPSYNYHDPTPIQWMLHPVTQLVQSIPEASHLDASGATAWCTSPHGLYAGSSLHCNEPEPSEREDPCSSTSTTVSRSRQGTNNGPKTARERFVWTDSWHGSFVNAIFCTGLKKALPNEIFSAIQDKSNNVYTQCKAVDDKLRQYRAKQPEIAEMLLLLQRERASEAQQCAKRRRLNVPTPDNAGMQDDASKKALNFPMKHCILTLPFLTDEEERSSLGMSLGSLVGMLKVLEQKLVEQRAFSNTIV